MTLSDNGQFLNSFQGNTSYIPLCGVIQNKYEDFTNFGQYKYNIAAGSGQAVAGDPVKVVNQIGSTANANAIESLNAVTGEIKQKATTIAELDGFLCQSPTDIVPLQGGEAYPVAGFLSYVALLGSGIDLYLPCDTTLINVDFNTRVTWDFINGVLTKAIVGTDQPIIARIKSAVVNAKELVYNDTTKMASWQDCTGILVELSCMNEGIEST